MERKNCGSINMGLTHLLLGRMGKHLVSRRRLLAAMKGQFALSAGRLDTTQLRQIFMFDGFDGKWLHPKCLHYANERLELESEATAKLAIAFAKAKLPVPTKLITELFQFIEEQRVLLNNAIEQNRSGIKCDPRLRQQFHSVQVVKKRLTHCLPELRKSLDKNL